MVQRVDWKLGCVRRRPLGWNVWGVCRLHRPDPLLCRIYCSRRYSCEFRYGTTALALKTRMLCLLCKFRSLWKLHAFFHCVPAAPANSCFIIHLIHNLPFLLTFKLFILQQVLEKFEYLPIKCNVTLGKMCCQRNHETLKGKSIWGNRTPRTKVDARIPSYCSIPWFAKLSINHGIFSKQYRILSLFEYL
jgi:hypothetical protein